MYNLFLVPTAKTAQGSTVIRSCDERRINKISTNYENPCGNSNSNKNSIRILCEFIWIRIQFESLEFEFDTNSPLRSILGNSNSWYRIQNSNSLFMWILGNSNSWYRIQNSNSLFMWIRFSNSHQNNPSEFKIKFTLNSEFIFQEFMFENEFSWIHFWIRIVEFRSEFFNNSASNSEFTRIRWLNSWIEFEFWANSYANCHNSNSRIA